MTIIPLKMPSARSKKPNPNKKPRWNVIENLEMFVPMLQDAPDDYTRTDTFLGVVIHTGTDMSKNDNDPFGDGDQSKVILDFHRFISYNCFEQINNCVGARKLSELFIADLSSHPFLYSCTNGNTVEVEKQMKKTAVGSKERTQLLEERDNLFRCSALLQMAHAKSMGNGNRVNTVRTLLQYGARPDARDLCGNNVLHYLAKVSGEFGMHNSII